MTLEQLYARHHAALVGRLAAYARDTHGAEDAVQQAYLRALAHGGLERMAEAAARAWLYTTAKNALTDEKRKQGRWTVLESDAQLELDEPDRDDMIVLQTLLEALEPDQRQLVSLRYLSGLNSAAIGRMLGIPAATVRTRLRAAMGALRRRLGTPDTWHQR